MKTFLFVLLLALAACAPERVQYTTQHPNVDFNNYRTFNFMDVRARNEAALQGPGADVVALKQAIAREMYRRGYQQAANPDLWVNIGVVPQQKGKARAKTVREAPRYIGQRTYRWQGQDVEAGRYAEGTATVEVVDAARKEMIWDGALVSILSTTAEPPAKRIDAAIAELFEKYPVPPQQ